MKPSNCCIVMYGIELPIFPSLRHLIRLYVNSWRMYDTSSEKFPNYFDSFAADENTTTSLRMWIEKKYKTKVSPLVIQLNSNLAHLVRYAISKNKDIIVNIEKSNLYAINQVFDIK